MPKYAYSYSQNITLICSFVLNMLQNQNGPNMHLYAQKNLPIFFRMLEIEFKSVRKLKQSHSKKYDVS